PYDIIKNGALDLEPGITSAEEKKIIAACTSKRTRVIYVHDLRWSYYLAVDTKAADKKIKLKNYGKKYLGYIGKEDYKIKDKNGVSTTVTVKKVNTATGEIELTAAIGQVFKVADKAALLWPLGGLSGDPLFVGDQGSLDKIKNYVAHELGHQAADL